MAIGDPYISVEQLKSVLGITDDSEDTLIQRAVNGASRAIEKRTGYRATGFWNTVTAEARTVETQGRLVPNRTRGYYKLLLPEPIASTAGLAVAGVTGDLRGLDVRTGYPIEALRIPYGTIPETYSITAIWGWAEVPDDIVMACQMQAHRYYKRRGSPEGMSGSAEWGVVRIPNLDPDVKAILEGGGYMNPGVG